MTARIRGPLVAACLIALTFAASAPAPAVAAGPMAAAADTTSTVGWVRLAQLSPGASAIDWYVYPAGSTDARVAQKDATPGTFSPYESLTPGSYLVAVHAAGNAPTGSPLATTQIAVTAGQAYTIASLGTASVPTLRLLNDKLDTTLGKAGVRVLDAAQRNPAVSVSVSGVTIAPDVRYPNVTDYQAVATGPGTVRVSTPTANGGATTQANFAAGSTYTVVVLDGSGSSPQIVELSDASGVGVPPKGGVSTGFGGTAAKVAGAGSASEAGSGATLPAYSVVLLIVAGGAVAFGMYRRRRSAA